MSRNAHRYVITKRSNLQRLLLVASIILIVFCITGCGNKKIEYYSDEVEKADEDIGGNSNSPNIKISETLGVEDVWEDGLDVDKKSIEINAAVSVPDINSVKIVSAEEKQFDEAYKKEIVEALSDGEIYFYDEDHLTKKEIMEKIVYAKSVINDMEEDDDSAKEDIVSMKAYLEELNQLHENAPDNYVIATDYSIETYRIQIDGIEYVITFYPESDTRFKEISLAPIRNSDFFNETSQEDTDFNYNSESGGYRSQSNECSLELEDVVKKADDFLAGIGIEDFKVVNSTNLVWQNEAGELIDNGCSLTLYRYIDGVAVEADFETEKIVLHINDKGVIRFSYYYPLEIKEVVENDVNVLSYESVKSSMLQALSQKSVEWESSQIKYNTLELLYYKCKESDESNQSSIIPVWRLKYLDNTNATLRVTIINAIDGSYIILKPPTTIVTN